MYPKQVPDAHRQKTYNRWQRVCWKVARNVNNIPDSCRAQLSVQLFSGRWQNAQVLGETWEQEYILGNAELLLTIATQLSTFKPQDPDALGALAAASWSRSERRVRSQGGSGRDVDFAHTQKLNVATRT
jgi:hypothetical protein